MGTGMNSYRYEFIPVPIRSSVFVYEILYWYEMLYRYEFIPVPFVALYSFTWYRYEMSYRYKSYRYEFTPVLVVVVRNLTTLYSVPVSWGLVPVRDEWLSFLGRVAKPVDGNKAPKWLVRTRAHMKLCIIPGKWLPCKAVRNLIDSVPEWNSYRYNLNTPLL